MNTTQEGGDCHNSSGVQVVDCNSLILVAIILDNTLDQYVKWPTQENIVYGVANNVELHV